MVVLDHVRDSLTTLQLDILPVAKQAPILTLPPRTPPGNPGCLTHSGESQSGRKRKGLQINKILLQPNTTTYFNQRHQIPNNTGKVDGDQRRMFDLLWGVPERPKTKERHPRSLGCLTRSGESQSGRKRRKDAPRSLGRLTHPGESQGGRKRSDIYM